MTNIYPKKAKLSEIIWYKTPTQNVQHKEYNMNLKKIFYTVICLAFTMSITVGASFKTITEKISNDFYKYEEDATLGELEFDKETYNYTSGELIGQDERHKIFICGHILQTQLSEKYKKEIAPFFRMNLTKDQWLELSKFNVSIMKDGKNFGEIARNILTVKSKDENEKNFYENAKINLKEIEPVRKINSGKKYIYISGGIFDFENESKKLPIYMKIYIYPEKDDMKVVILVAKAEEKSLLLYAFDNVVLRMANGE